MKLIANALEGLRKLRGDWRRPEALLIVMALAMPLSFATWQALLNNFVIEEASFTGVEIGILQSLREVPGFLAFTVVFVLLVVREQTFAMVALCLTGIGTALTGFFPFAIGLYCTTVLMSTGFHYFETVRQSLALQWVSKDRAPLFLGQMIAVGSFSGLTAFGLIYLAFEVWELGMQWVYLLGGSATCALTIWAWIAFPRFPAKVDQRRRLILRRRYWLYYAIVFMSGARRQIFVVFAGFLMVEKFGFSVKTMTLMFLANLFMNIIMAPLIGKLIGRWGERRALTCEYIGLIAVFLGYAFVSSPWIAVGLYIVDHLFFAMSIAIKTYFQKIADPADIASSMGVSFTINHIAAVVIPVLFGLLWIISPSAVFLAGAAMAVLSLALARMVPPAPSQEIVSVFTRTPVVAAAD